VNTSRATADSGQATVEFALILPLFVLLIVALMDVTVIIRDQLFVDMIARDASRIASTATARDDAVAAIDATIARTNRTDATWRVHWTDGLVTVQVSLEPRMSLSATSLRWLGIRQRVQATASFPTEYEFFEQ
jgi:Flp pilus assembly protein TadG